jgi:hypothetical protein
MIRRILSLIYEFEFPNKINIYSIISIVYLKLISKNSDLYNRFRNNYSVPVKEDPWNNVEKNNENSKSKNLRIAVRNGTVEIKKNFKNFIK